MLKLLRNICIWMCSTSWLFGYVIHAVPLEYFDDHEFSYDMDTAQSKVKYDPRLLSQHLKDQHNHPQERAAPCYSATNKYSHGQRISREDPCEVCLCVDGEIFCWWKKCDNPKRRKFKLEKTPRPAKSKKDKQIDRMHREQLHLKQKKKLEKKLRRQHWQQQQKQLQQQQQHAGVRSKILTFPENLPSVLYYDYKTEDQHGFQHGNHEKPPSSSSDVMGHNSVQARVNGKGMVNRGSSHGVEVDMGVDDDDDDDEVGGGGISGGDDASSAVGVAEPEPEPEPEPASTEMKFVAKSHSATEASKKISLQQTSTARITTTTTTMAAAAGAGVEAMASEPFSSEHFKDDRLSMDNQFISGHPAGDVQMLNMDSTRHAPDPSMFQQNRTAIQDKTAFMLSQSQEIDRDGILRDGEPDGKGDKQSNIPVQPKGGRTSFRSSFNDFRSEFNASAAVDLDLITGQNDGHDAPIILEADSIVNTSTLSSVSLSESLSSKHDDNELNGNTNDNNEQDNPNNMNSNNNSNRDNSVLSTTTMASTTIVSPEQECIVMGASYKIGAVLPQETGNCLQCICIEGATKDDTPRVTCSPHNCPPLVLPDLFDATGY